MLKTTYAITAAAIVSAAFIAFLSLSMQVEAHISAAKSDRAYVRPPGTKCSQRAWPYFEVACLRNVRRLFGHVRDVRIDSADRL